MLCRFFEVPAKNNLQFAWKAKSSNALEAKPSKHMKSVIFYLHDVQQRHDVLYAFGDISQSATYSNLGCSLIIPRNMRSQYVSFIESFCIKYKLTKRYTLDFWPMKHKLLCSAQFQSKWTQKSFNLITQKSRKTKKATNSTHTLGWI